MGNAWRVTYQQAGPSVQMMRVFFVWAAEDMLVADQPPDPGWQQTANAYELVQEPRKVCKVRKVRTALIKGRGRNARNLHNPQRLSLIHI